MPDDRKQHKRHPPEVLRVRLEHPSGGERAEAIAWDASLGGLFLETDVSLDEGSLVALEIETGTAKVAVDARVLWKRDEAEGEDHPRGMSVRFLDLTDEVKIALTNAIIGKQERTILGVGGATIESTTPGLKPPKENTILGVGAPTGGSPAPDSRPSEPTPRATQLGVAPPANAPAASAEPSVSIALDLVTKKPSEPKVAIAREEPKSAPRVETSRDDDTKKRVARARPVDEDDEPPPRKKGGAGGTLFLALLLAAGGGAAYYYRDEIAKTIAPQPPPTTAPATPETASAPPIASAPPSAIPSAEPVSTAATDLDSGAKEAGAADAGGKDAGHDAGHHGKDGGTHVHDAGSHVHDAGKPAPKHSGPKPDHP